MHEISEQNDFTLAQQEWLKLRLGMYVCYSISNFYMSGSWSDGTLDPKGVNPSSFMPEQWAETARKAGMKYVIIVTMV